MRNGLVNNRLLSNGELTQDLLRYYDRMLMVATIEHILLTEGSIHLWSASKTNQHRPRWVVHTIRRTILCWTTQRLDKAQSTLHP